jgi:hypothetical protein
VFQSAKNQRVVTDNHVAIFGDGFIDNFLGNIQANQGFMRFCVEVAHLQSSVVVTLLPMQWRHLGNAVQNVFYGHIFKIEAQN